MATGSKVHALLKSVQNGKTLRDCHTAKTFLNALIESDDDLGTLYVLTQEDLDGEKSVKKALSLVNSSAEILKFLAFLGKDDLNKGSAKQCVEKCYMTAFETPGLLPLLLDDLKNRRIKLNSDCIVLTWFLVAVVRIDPSSREDRKVLEMVDILLGMHKSDAGDAISALLYSHFHKTEDRGGAVAFDPRCVQSLANLQDLSPQHDNDFPLDFRRIEILPTVEELKSSSLVGIALCGHDSSVPIGVASSRVLERQFRLLREDMLAPMKEEMKTELELPQNKQRRVFNAPELVDVVLEPRACLLVRVGVPPLLRGRLKSMKPKEISAFFEEGGGRRVLGKESMVAFIGKDKASGHEVKAVGLVVRRDPKEFAVHQGFLTVGIAFSDDIIHEMLSLLEFQPNREHSSGNQDDKHSNKGKSFMRGTRYSTCIFQATSSYFSYEPVLRTLQDMDNIPFAEELVMNSPPLPVEASNGYRMPSSVRDKLQSDLSQLQAVERAMLQRVSLVQGPPGTG